jgi:hypothetical protein
MRPSSVCLVLLAVCLFVGPAAAALPADAVPPATDDKISAAAAAAATGVRSKVTAPAGGWGEFIPTDEWQEIMPGQHIPPGLWVLLLH